LLVARHCVRSEAIQRSGWIAAAPSEPRNDEGMPSMIGIIIAVILAILLIGLLLKIIKVAIILALCVGILMFAQNKFGRKQIK
jgi:hypothetical protein